MTNKTKVTKFCGNCDSHDLYEFPSKIFCSIRYNQDKDPIVDTLWHCEHWSSVSQKCHCVREALSEKNGH